VIWQEPRWAAAGTPVKNSFSLGLDGDSLRFGRGALGHLDGQDPVFQPGLDLGGIHADGQGDGLLEAAEAALLVVPLDLLQRRRLPLALEGELAIGGDRDLEVGNFRPGSSASA
jgi:hypothetical protein